MHVAIVLLASIVSNYAIAHTNSLDKDLLNHNARLFDANTQEQSTSTEVLESEVNADNVKQLKHMKKKAKINKVALFAILLSVAGTIAGTYSNGTPDILLNTHGVLGESGDFDTNIMRQQPLSDYVSYAVASADTMSIDNTSDIDSSRVMSTSGSVAPNRISVPVSAHTAKTSNAITDTILLYPAMRLIDYVTIRPDDPDDITCFNYSITPLMQGLISKSQLQLFLFTGNQLCPICSSPETRRLYDNQNMRDAKLHELSVILNPINLLKKRLNLLRALQHKHLQPKYSRSSSYDMQIEILHRIRLIIWMLYQPILNKDYIFINVTQANEYLSMERDWHKVSAEFKTYVNMYTVGSKKSVSSRSAGAPKSRSAYHTITTDTAIVEPIQRSQSCSSANATKVPEPVDEMFS